MLTSSTQTADSVAADVLLDRGSTQPRVEPHVVQHAVPHVASLKAL